MAEDTRKKPAIRHVEKRRISTCTFADRIAESALAAYRSSVEPKPHPTCLAAILLHQAGSDQISVLALGVGTKFLTEQLLRQEENEAFVSPDQPYGRRVRDLHGEVLCRRAFRYYLSQRILSQARGDALDTQHVDFLERTSNTTWKLRPDCTLHAYFSSTPCGNSTVKKFAKISKDVFRPNLIGWPLERHAVQVGHSIHLGQFALLLKKDATHVSNNREDDGENLATTISDSTGHVPTVNIPIGTVAVDQPNGGSLHTCSDKVCRWNCLGWQGSFLATLVEEPLHMHSITVGRKYASTCFQRAVCCRISCDPPKLKDFPVHHPATMCTAVYMDPDATLATASPECDDGDSPGSHDLQFTSTDSFVWWPGLIRAQKIDGKTGFAVWENEKDTESHASPASPVCTRELLRIFRTIQRELAPNCFTNNNIDSNSAATRETALNCEKEMDLPHTLGELRQLKKRLSPKYEESKERLFRHKVMRSWKRRYPLG